MPEVTTQPRGEYPQPEAMHQIDLEQEADVLLGELPGHGHRTRSVARESGVSLIMMAMEAGYVVPEHGAAGAAIMQVVRGHTTLSSGGRSADLRRGELVFFQPGVRHDLRAEEQSVVLLIVTGGDE
jgi:quercetin dioxygenase-like cupin family protein